MNRGRAAIYSHQKRIQTAFARASLLRDDQELLADFAKYLCIIVSGFIEKSLMEIVLEHARRTGAPSLQKFVEHKTSRFTSANSENILKLLGSFDSHWRSQVEKLLIDEYKAAFDSIVDLRHQIAHGKSVGVTYVRVNKYFRDVIFMIDRIQNICIPDIK